MVNKKVIQKILSDSASINIILDLNIEGKKESAIVHDVQINPITNEIEHVDFQHIDINSPIKAHVPVHLIGVAPGVKKGGILVHYVHEITIKSLPLDIPPAIEVDISTLTDIGSEIKISSLKLQNKIEILYPSQETTIAKIDIPAKEETQQQVKTTEKVEEKTKEEKDTKGTKENKDK